MNNLKEFKSFCKTICAFNNATEIINYLINLVKKEYNINVQIYMPNIPEKITKKSLNEFLDAFVSNNNQINNDIKLAFIDYIYKAGHCLSTLKNNVSLSISDFIIDDNIINEYKKEVNHAKTIVDKDTILKKYLQRAKDDLKSRNSAILHIIESGARASDSQLKQIVLSRGALDTGFSTKFIVNGYIKGLTLEEFEESALAARKALYDKTISTAKPGYLTRQLIYALSHLSIDEDDCGSKNYYTYKVTEENHKSFKGKYYYDINERKEKLIEDTSKFINKTIHVRSALFCKSKTLCRKCVGEYHYPFKNIGIITAQTLGERATQLTLRVFHTGSSVDMKSELNTISKQYPDYIVFENNNLKVLKNASLVLPNDVIIASNSNILMNNINAKLKFDDNLEITIEITQGSRLLYNKLNNIPANTNIIQINPVTITNAINVVENFLRKKIILENESQFANYMKIITKLFSYETSFPIFMYELLALALLTNIDDVPVSVTKEIKFPLVKQPLKIIPHLLGIGFMFESPRYSLKKKIKNKLNVYTPLKDILTM